MLSYILWTEIISIHNSSLGATSNAYFLVCSMRREMLSGIKLVRDLDAQQAYLISQGTGLKTQETDRILVSYCQI